MESAAGAQAVTNGGLARTRLGVAVSGFPNLFMLYGLYNLGHSASR
jgi:hypothetical protein